MKHCVWDIESVHTQNSYPSSKITKVNQYYNKVTLRTQSNIMMPGCYNRKA